MIDERIQRIKSIEREYRAIRCAITYWLQSAPQVPAVAIQHDLNVRDFDNASDLLEGTYIVRLFAEFETILRVLWSALRNADPPSRTRDLLDGIAATRRIPDDRLRCAHDVREYRNLLVHERDEQTAPLSIIDARRHLCRFLSFLPPNW